MHTWKVATLVVVSGVTLFVVYRCYKYGSIFGEKEKKQEEQKGEETSGSASPASQTSEVKTMKRRKRHRRRRARTRPTTTPSALHESSTDSSSVIKN